MSEILILDDDPRFRGLIASVLQINGHEVVMAGNAAQARELLSNRKIDLAIVDYKLPDMDGIQWISWLRNEGMRVPVIFLSGFLCDRAMLEKLRNFLSVSVILRKPIEPAAFAATVEEQLQKGEATTEASIADPQECIQLISQLSREYLAEVPARLIRVAQDINTAASHRSEPDLKMAIDEVHRLRGTSGCYGLKHLGESMGVVEELLQEMKTGVPVERQVSIWSAVEQTMLDSMTFAMKESAERQ